MQKKLTKLTLVLGGAASGKSVFAEKLLLESGLRPVYLATAERIDAETNAKIDLHQSRRDENWRTIEAPLDLATPLAARAAGEAVLLDCATMWLGNLLHHAHPLEPALNDLIAALTTSAAPVVIVSNEVGQGIVPENALARQFREAQGRLNIALAQEAHLVLQVVAGLPNVLKGALP